MFDWVIDFRNCSITAKYSAFQVSLKASAPSSLARKYCQLNIDLQYPAGLQYRVKETGFQDQADLGDGVTSQHQATYYFSGSVYSVSRLSPNFSLRYKITFIPKWSRGEEVLIPTYRFEPNNSISHLYRIDPRWIQHSRRGTCRFGRLVAMRIAFTSKHQKYSHHAERYWRKRSWA
jgi:hypothetical protein